MKESRFRGQQIAFAVQQAEVGTPVLEVCRKVGITEQTSYRWKKRFAGLMPSCLKQVTCLRSCNRLIENDQ